MATGISSELKYGDDYGPIITTQKLEQDGLINDESILSQVENNAKNLDSCDYHSSKTTEDTTEVFNAIQSADLLKDKRRTRIKSTGRPPSQLFMKETILQNYFSMDTEGVENEEIKDTQIDYLSKSSEIPQLINESQQPKLIAVVNAMSTVLTEFSSSSSWNKIPLRRIPKTLQSNEKTDDKKPPWMKEILARRHKTSLSDELLNMEEKHERHTVLTITPRDTPTSKVVEEINPNKIVNAEAAVERIDSGANLTNGVKSVADPLSNHPKQTNVGDKSNAVIAEILKPSVTIEKQPTNESGKKRANEAVETVKLSVGIEYQSTAEIVKKPDDPNIKSATSVLEEIEIYLIKSKAKQENLLQQIKDLQLSVQNRFEEETAAIIHLKKNVIQMMET